MIFGKMLGYQFSKKIDKIKVYCVYWIDKVEIISWKL